MAVFSCAGVFFFVFVLAVNKIPLCDCGVSDLDDAEPRCFSRFDYEYKVIQRLADLERSVRELGTKVNGIEEARPRVAFTAALSQDLSSFPDHAPILFDVIVTNIGESYNPATGVFSCKVPGVYMFFWVTTNRDLTYMNTELVLNGDIKAITFSDAGDTHDYFVASNMAVLDLKFGDQVWVRSGTWHNGRMAGDMRSAFSGWILY